MLPWLPSWAEASALPRLVIIIDDLGDNLALGLRALDLPGRVTPAILPHTPHAVALANRAHEAGLEVMLHLPMSNHNGRHPGPGALHAGMDRALFDDTLLRNLAAVPHVSGVNNHMGSKLTERPLAMTWLMRELRRQGLYFVDSRTSRHTIAERQAGLQGVPNLRRDVFLDHDPAPQAVAARFEELVTRARRQGVAVGIGHPYPETLALLERKLPGLALRGVELVHPGEVLGGREMACTGPPYTLPPPYPWSVSGCFPRYTGGVGVAVSAAR